jgi:O-acetylhomoserine (thiol)-lyase
MPRHCESALAVARHLEAHPAVEWVNYPCSGIATSRSRALSAARRRRDPDVRRAGRKESAARRGPRFIEGVEFLSHLANIGDAKTCHIIRRRRRIDS